MIFGWIRALPWAIYAVGGRHNHTVGKDTDRSRSEIERGGGGGGEV